MEEEKMKQKMQEFQKLCCPFGHLDLQQAIKIADEANMDEEEVYNKVKEHCEETDISFEDVDVVALVLEDIFQHARNQLDVFLGTDIENDLDFYVYGNYLDSGIDYREEDKHNLLGKIKRLDIYDITELLDDSKSKAFFSQIDILEEINKIPGVNYVYQ